VNADKKDCKIMVSQRWKPDLKARVEAAADELGQTVSTFTERALEAYFEAVEEQRRAASALKPKPRKRGKGGAVSEQGQREG